MRRNKHALSNTKLFSFDTGELIPCGLIEVLPGDTFQHATSLLVRASPLLAPLMHKVDVRIHHWYVPTRLVWEDFEEFITGGPDGMDDSEFPTITVDNNDIAVGDLLDYMGIPPLVAATFSAIPARGYAMIWNEFYRDQDLDTPLVIDLTSGVDTTTSKALQRVRWDKDYFTSARPWEQKGPNITIPIGTTAPVVSGSAAGGNPNQMRRADTGALANTATAISHTAAGVLQNTNGVALFLDPNGRLNADLSSASAITVIRLREALAAQRYEEARSRYGSRYPEYLRYLGVRSSDARLQRPEYLGGGSAPVQFSEVLQTAEGDDPVGEMRGHGISTVRSNRYRRFFEEHGYVFSLLSVKPRAIYASGLDRHWNRRTKEDFWQKEFEHIGQQEILNKEVYAAHASPDGTFGFQDRYDEYRRAWSTIAGEFRTVLDHWHFARIFGSTPALNSTFVECSPADDRVFAVPSQDVLYAMARHSIQARRLVSPTGKSFIF